MLDHDLIAADVPGSKRLMVVLHGLGDSMEGYRWLPGALGLPWLNYLLVNAPDDYFGGFSWFDIYGDAEPGVKRSERLVFDLLDALPARGYQASDVMVFGFSQGSLLTIETGARYPHRLAGLIGISGYVYDLKALLGALSPIARQQRFLLTHGTLDPMIPIAPVRGQVQLLKNAGLQIEWREYAKVHTIDDREELGVVRAFTERCFAPAVGP